MSEKKIHYNEDTDLNVFSIMLLIWDKKIKIILITSIFAIASIVYSLVVDEEYEVSCLLNPVDPNPEIVLGNISSFSGFSLTGVNETPVVKQITLTLGSIDFLRIFYNKYKNDERLFGDSFDKINEDIEMEERTKEEAKFHAGIKKLLKTITSSVNSTNNAIELKVRLEDKYFAKDFLNDFVLTLKEYIKEENYKILSDDIKYYRKIISNIEDPRLVLKFENKLLEKIEKRNLLSSNMFTVISKPYIPYKRVFPIRSLIVVLTTIISFFVTVTSVVLYTFINENINKYKSLKKG